MYYSCPKCGAIAEYNAYYGRITCTSCNWEGNKEDLADEMSQLKSLNFVRTCGACPEQYDVFDGEEQVGYVRLRWGNLTVECPDCGGEYVYDYSFSDGFKGCFENDTERKHFLGEIEKAILDYRNKVSE